MIMDDCYVYGLCIAYQTQNTAENRSIIQQSDADTVFAVWTALK
jgi:hypothetical protein